MAGYIGNRPTALPITTSDLADGIVSVAKLSSTLDLSSNTVTLPSNVGGITQGKVLQVIMGAQDTSTVINSTSYTNLSFDAQITLASTSNKVYVSFAGSLTQDDADGALLTARLLRDISGGTQGTELQFGFFSTDISNGEHGNAFCFNYLDSPSSTAQLTYRLQGKTTSGSSDFRSKSGRIVLMEIAG